MSLWSLIVSALLVAFFGFAFSRTFQRVTVFEYQHALRFSRGRFVSALTPGSYWIFSPDTVIELIDARPRVVTVSGQEVLSADGVSLKVSLLLDYRVSDPQRATLEAADFEEALYAAAQSALREAIGERPMEEVLTARGELGARMRTQIDPSAEALGVELRGVSVKDIMFPGALKEVFAQTARAKQEAQAALERARGESAALRHLANASRLLESHPSLYPLRVLQSAAEGGTLVVNMSPPKSEDSGSASSPD